jgi:hypothetical protein
LWKRGRMVSPQMLAAAYAGLRLNGAATEVTLLAIVGEA